MNYKQIVKNRKTRIKILNLLRFVPDKIMIELQYYLKLSRKLNLKQPRRFTEKIQWYKLYYREPTMEKCVDKYLVRDYVESKGLSHILNNVHGIYANVDSVNMSDLPPKFVAKLTNGGGGLNIILCNDKTQLNLEEFKNTLSTWLNSKKISGGREWVYNRLEPKILIEEYLVNKENPEAGITDYKFFCFNGRVKYLVVDVDRYTGHKRNFYDTDWNYIDVSSDCPNFEDVLVKPEGLEEMIEVASKLSEGIPFVRVDLYYVDKRVIFGEMTFFPWSGYVRFTPDEFDYTLGEEFVLPKN